MAGRRQRGEIAPQVAQRVIALVRGAVIDVIDWFDRLTLSGFEWPEIPTLDLSGRFETLTGWNLPDFEWPTIPEFSLAAFVGWITSWRLPSFSWPEVGSLRLSLHPQKESRRSSSEVWRDASATCSRPR